MARSNDRCSCKAPPKPERLPPTRAFGFWLFPSSQRLQSRGFGIALLSVTSTMRSICEPLRVLPLRYGPPRRPGLRAPKLELQPSPPRAIACRYLDLSRRLRRSWPATMRRCSWGWCRGQGTRARSNRRRRPRRAAWERRCRLFCETPQARAHGCGNANLSRGARTVRHAHADCCAARSATSASPYSEQQGRQPWGYLAVSAWRVRSSRNCGS